MKKAKKSSRLKATAIGNVTVTKSPAGMPNMVNVKVAATNITAPFAPPATCIPGTVSALLERKSGSAWVFEAGPQAMSGNISSGFEITFGPRPDGVFKGTVTINWMVSFPESSSGFSS